MLFHTRDPELNRIIRTFGNLGIDLLVGVLLGTYVGHLLDKWYGPEPLFTILGFIIGAAAGFKSVFNTIKKNIDTSTGLSEKSKKKK